MRSALIVALLVGTLLLWHLTGRAGRRAPLVVYCAHDAIYSEKILQRFEQRTGIPIAMRFDTEATKSLGLVELIIREKEAPRCDVFWNNELLGMLVLQEKGILLPYKGDGFNRIPAAFKDADGNWAGFAARLRVFILDQNKARAEDLPRILAGDLSRVGIAKPLYGTTLTHYSLLWQQWGRERLIAWHRDCRARGIREFTGNAAVKDAVAGAVCDAGFTDTDDFFEAKDAGAPVSMTPVRMENGQTICIPNTVAIIRGTPRETNARKLVDFLLSAETELALSHSPSRQIPLGPVPAADLPDEVRQLAAWAAEGVPLPALRDARAECMAWLKSEYLQ
jgi:iron(III) transport system substrate-binding protein